MVPVLFWALLLNIVLAGSALYLWRKGPPVEHRATPGEWAATILGSVLFGAASFGIDILIGSFNHPELTLVEAGTRAGTPFGFVLTLMLCPGLTMLAVAGLLRALLLRRASESSNSWLVGLSEVDSDCFR